MSTSTPQNVDQLWTVQDVSAYLRVSIETLYQWRKKRRGPPARRIGRHLRYDPVAVKRWFNDQAA